MTNQRESGEKAYEMQSKNAVENQCRNASYVKCQKVPLDVTVIRI